MRATQLLILAGAAIFCVAYQATTTDVTAHSQAPAESREFAGSLNLQQLDVKFEARLLLPARGRVRAVMIVTRHGVGESFYQRPPVQALTASHQLGLLLLRASRITRNAGVLDADREVANALQELMRRLSEDSARPEVATAPLIFWGHSAGGRFGSTYATLHPTRTIAFVRFHSGPAGADDLKALKGVPALLMFGGKDEVGPKEVPPEAARTAIHDVWVKGRAEGAPWTFALDPNAEHATGVPEANELLVPWIAAVLEQRLADDGSLRPIREESGWLADRNSGKVAPYAAYDGPKLSASWLPDEKSAEAWRKLGGFVR